MTPNIYTRSSVLTNMATINTPTNAELSRWQLKPGKTNSNNERKFVKHKYTDYSHEQPTQSESSKLIESFESKTRIPFPLRLHRALVMAEEDDYGHVFAWLKHGRAFKVFNRKVFIAEVLPKYIGLKYDSYLRQCNLYGFRRLTKASGDISRNAVYHELFLKEMEFLSLRMRPIKVNGNGVKPANRFDQEPKFFDMPYCCQTRGKVNEEEHECNFAETLEESLFSEPSSTQGYQIDPNASLRNQVHTSSFALNACVERACHLSRSSTFLSWMDPIPVDLTSQNPTKAGVNNRTITTSLDVSSKVTFLDSDPDIVYDNQLRFESPQELSKELRVIQDIMEADETNEACFDENDDVILGMLDTFADENNFNLELL